jgi:type I restriction enzyme S subunit
MYFKGSCHLKNPLGWNKVKFGQIAKKKSIRISNPKESDWERYVGLEHLDSNELVVRRWGSTSDVSSSMQLFHKNDILFARRNTYLRRVSVALFEGICSGDIIVIEPILNHVVEGFLPIYMQFEDFENRVIAWSAGAFSKRIKWDQLAEFEVWIPSKKEQIEIVSVIWAIHENQKKLEKLIECLGRLKNGLTLELLTKGIGHNKFKESRLGLIPDEWNIVKLEDVCSVRKRGTDTQSDLYIGLEHIGQGNNQLISKGSVKDFLSEKNTFLKGDILYGKLRPLLNKVYLAEQDGFCSTDILPLITNDKILKEILVWILSSDRFVNYADSNSSGTKMPRTNWNDMKNFLIPLGMIYEQQRIASVLGKVDETVRKIQSNLEIKRQLKDQLINEFLSGKLLRLKEIAK